MYDLDVSALHRAWYRKQPTRAEASGKAGLGLADRVGEWPVDFTRDSRAPRETALEFIINRDGRLDGFLGWFEATLRDALTVSDSPRLAATGWAKCTFPRLSSPPFAPDRGSCRRSIRARSVAGVPGPTW